MDFENINKNIESIDFEKGIESIPDYAFASCYKVKEIVIPDSVVEIGKGAFQNCTSLEKVVLPKNIENIPNNLFLNCKKLEKLVIPDGVKNIGDLAFFGTKIKSMKIPKSVKTIGNGAFTGVSEFEIYDGFDYSINKYNIFTWLSEPIYDRETDGTVPQTYDFIKNVVITILDDDTSDIKFKFFIPFRDKFDIFSITKEIFVNNRLDLALLDSQFQMIRDFDSKTRYVYYRVLYPYKLSLENAEMFTRFIKSNSVKIAEKFIDENTITPLVTLEKFNLLSAQNIDEVVEYANVNRKFNSLSYLMNYKNEHFNNRYSLQI